MPLAGATELGATRNRLRCTPPCASAITQTRSLARGLLVCDFSACTTQCSIDIRSSLRIGNVYRAEATTPSGNSVVALKRVRFAWGYTPHPILRHEACALVLLQGHPSIAEVYAWGATQYYEYLAMQLLGVNLAEYFRKRPRSLTVRNLGAIAIQMLDALRHVHSQGILHCDIAPQNMTFECGSTPSARIYLIDFGICRPYRHEEKHVPDIPTPRIRGSFCYASINNHHHHTLSRRDDMESLSYAIAALLLGDLPWLRFGSAVFGRDSTRICRWKQSHSGQVLCAGWPKVFGAFVDYCRGLDFTESPDYSRWQSTFKAVAPGRLDNFDYDIADDTAPVGWRRVRLTVDEESALELPAETPWTPVIGSCDDYMPVSSWDWETARTLKADDTLGDEPAVVERITRLDDVPTCPQSDLASSCETEVMLTNEEMFDECVSEQEST
ncbi:kinase-like domain-containing protein [Earliella scabrosa]|nr:kinase-like domain-containing protein [Earliella scabrosa]